ncbi:GTPase IMAP family member 1 [Varanus komodoensis]|nr:GTPase IMAP family member 1 [Varanus komodoensis]
MSHNYLKGTPLQEFIDSAGRELRDLLALAEGRCVGFNNLAEEPERSRQVTELFGVIDGMRRSNTNMPYYSKAALEEDTSSRGSCSLL